jgi:sugar transferase EpsL
MKSLQLKYMIDFFLALLLLIVLSPLFVLISLLILVQTRDNIFFSQARGGHQGKVFNIYKFKTMRDMFLPDGQPAADKLRVTKFGLFLRSTSLDELPSLFNIIKGDMSFVGPRPFIAEYLPLYSAEQFRRHLARPGLTGWAQVNGRNAISWEEKFKLDVWYVENQSFWLDMKIMALTALKVLKRSGVSSEGHVTMSKFTGTKR